MLQAGDCANDFLLTTNPKLQGKDAVVNKGDVHCSKLPFSSAYGQHPEQSKVNVLRQVPRPHEYDSDFDS